MNITQRVNRDAGKLLDLFGPKGQHWTKGNYAVSEDGDVTSPKDRNAAKWCLSGAMEKLRISGGVADFMTEYLRESKRSQYYTLEDFNDSRRSYAEVRSFLTKLRTLKHTPAKEKAKE